MEIKVQHDSATHRFFVKLDNEEACLHYSDKGEALDFYEVDVPQAYRAQGIASKILIEAFNYADQKGLEVVPSDDFVRTHFLPHHPQYERLVKPGEYPYT